MKRFIKSFLLTCLTLIGILSFTFTAQAAKDYTPSKVKSLKATAGESQVTLKWKKVSNASRYNIYLFNEKDNTLSKIASTTSTTYKIKKLKNNQTYTYCVSAARTVKKKTYEGSKSAYVKVTPQVKKPSVPSLKISSVGNTVINLKWNKISGATGYEVYQLDNTTKKYLPIGKVTKTSVTVKSLTNGQSYSFKIRAYRTVGGITRYGNFSSVKTGKPFTVSETAKSLSSMNYKATVKNTTSAKRLDNGKSISVKSGTQVTVITRRSPDSTCKLKDGTKVYIKNSNLRYKSCIYSSSKDLSTADKEAFVNSRGYHSNSKYLIWISLYKQRLYIFKGSQCNWKLYKSYLCSTGKAATPTPKGVRQITRKATFMEFDDYSYANYPCYFTSGNAIHSWVKLYGSGANYNDGKLGHPASHGCVRLKDKDILFFYKNIPVGTTCVIY